jgi:hypothetical protein
MRQELSSQQALEYNFERVHRDPRNKSMESSNQNHTQVAQEKLAQVLNLLGANGAWWYALYETNKDETNMLDLLGVDSITLSRIYEVCGFTFAVKGAPKAKFNKSKFDAFKTNHDLNIEVEMTVRSYYF